MIHKLNFDKDHICFVLSLFDTGVGIIHSLVKAGVDIIGLDYTKKMPGFKSRYCKKKFCPHPINQAEELLQFLVNIGKDLKKPGIFFPASDVFLIFLSRFRNELKSYFHLILPSEEIVESIVNKRRQYELAKETGIPFPETFYPKTFDDLEKIKRNLDYPVFIKPIFSYKWQEIFPPIKGFKVNNEEELESKFTEVQAAGIEIMIQEIIPGPNINHYKVNVYIDKENKVLALFVLRKIRQYPVEFGVGCCVESINEEEVKELGLKFFKGINYRGVGSIEFKKDPRDGKFKLIELNPRYWQQNYLSTVCGINFPLIQYLDLTGQNPRPQMEFRAGLKWWDMVADFQSFWHYYRHGKLSPWQWLYSLRNTKSIANFSLADSYPFLESIEYGFKFMKLPIYLLRNRKDEM